MQRSRYDDDDELHQKFESLEKDWDSFKQSKPRQRLRRHRSCNNVKSTVNMLQLLDNSPRKLISSLQHPQKRSSPFDGKEEWKVRDNELAVLEIMRERMEAIERGQLKGRNLLEALENAASDQEMGGLRAGYNNNNNNKEEIICSACSSVLIHGSEVRSLCSYSSTSAAAAAAAASADDEDDREVGCFGCDSSFSSSLYVEKEKEKEKEKMEEKRDVYVDASVCGSRESRDRGGGVGKGMIMMGWFTILLMMFALGIILLKSFEDGYGDEDFEIMLKPT